MQNITSKMNCQNIYLCFEINSNEFNLIQLKHKNTIFFQRLTTIKLCEHSNILLTFKFTRCKFKNRKNRYILLNK